MNVHSCKVTLSTMLYVIYRSPCEVLKSQMAWGRTDLLSLSVEQESDSCLSLKLLLCLQMAPCSGQEPIQSQWLCNRYQVVQDLYQQQSLPTSPVWPGMLHSWGCPTSTWLHTWGCSLSLVEDLEQLPSDDEGRQSSKEKQKQKVDPFLNRASVLAVQSVIQLHTQVFDQVHHLHTVPFYDN